MRWTWDDAKNRVNKRKHRLSFETAQFVFDDPLSAHRPDLGSDEERWHTIGMISGVVVIVAHMESHVEVGRIISARKATTHERRAYEEGSY